MSLYTTQTSPTSAANPSTDVHHFGGRDLAYELRGKSDAERARLAAKYGTDGGVVVLHDPTKGQLVALFRVTPYKLAKARNGGTHKVEVTDAAIDRFILRAGADRVMRGLDRHTAPRFAFAAE